MKHLCSVCTVVGRGSLSGWHCDDRHVDRSVCSHFNSGLLDSQTANFAWTTHRLQPALHPGSFPIWLKSFEFWMKLVINFEKKKSLWWQVATMTHLASNYLNAEVVAGRWGTGHTSIVPYQVFTAKRSGVQLKYLGLLGFNSWKRLRFGEVTQFFITTHILCFQGFQNSRWLHQHWLWKQRSVQEPMSGQLSKICIMRFIERKRTELYKSKLTQCTFFLVWVLFAGARFAGSGFWPRIRGKRTESEAQNETDRNFER